MVLLEYYPDTVYFHFPGPAFPDWHVKFRHDITVTVTVTQFKGPRDDFKFFPTFPTALLDSLKFDYIFKI